MSYIDTIPPQDARKDVRDMYQRQQKFWGYVPNYAKAFCHRPELMNRWGRMIAEVKRPMEPRLYELATFVAANDLRNTACSIAHGSKLHEFYSNEEIQALGRKEYVPGLTALDNAVARYARKVARDAASVTRAEVEELRNLGLDDETIFDIAAAAAARAFFTKVLDALGCDPDAPLAEFEPELGSTFLVGRPVSTKKPEVMNDIT